jgi:predicted alpha/beta superfamily hydrolase
MNRIQLQLIPAKSILLLFLIPFQINGQNDMIREVARPFESKKHIAGSIEERTLYSNETNSAFLLTVYLPPSYTDTQKKYPLMIINDASLVIGMAQSTFDCLTLLQEVPEVIVVGITYPQDNNLEITRNRFRDMTPTHSDGFEPSGKADSYIAFIKNELFPYIENNYRVDTTDKCFFGHSLGGLLGAHILVDQPDLFNRYILGSPSLFWDNFEVVKRLSNKSSISAVNLKAVYTYVGGDEGDMMINPLNKFNEFLRIKTGNSIKSHNQVYQGEGHMSVIPAAFSSAVKFVYK